MPGNTATTQPPAGASEYDAFSTAFDEILSGENNASTTQGSEDAGAAGAAGDATQQTQSPNGATDSGEPTPPGGDTATADGEGKQTPEGGDPAGSQSQPEGGVTPPAATPPAATPPTYEAQIAELQRQIAALTAAQAQPPATPPATPTPAPEPQLYSAEESAELADLQKEWPETARLFELMARQLKQSTLKYAFSEFERVLTPLQAAVGTMSGDAHLDAIYQAHADYDAVYQPVMDWIAKQPAFLKAAYEKVVAEGTSKDVTDMIQRFKDETKWQAPAAAAPAGATPPAATQQPAPSQKPAELSEAAKKAAQAIGAVGTKRSGMPTAQDPNDFDGGWDEANSTK